MIGELGGTLALCQMLNNAVNDHQLEGAHGQQATWICAAMWRLSFTPSNAEICLENATPALLAATQQTESAPLSAAALGCVNVAMSGGSKGLFERLEKLGVASALRSLASSAHFRESDRVTAALTIGNLNKKPEELGSTSRSGSPIGRRLGSPGSPVRSNATTETKRVSVLASEFEKKPKKATPRPKPRAKPKMDKKANASGKKKTPARKATKKKDNSTGSKKTTKKRKKYIERSDDESDGGWEGFKVIGEDAG